MKKKRKSIGRAISDVLKGKNIRDTQTVFLEFQTWVDTIACGQHYYGYLLCGQEGEPSFRPKRIEVEQVLTKATASVLDKEDGPDAPRHRAGDTSTRFHSQEAVVDWAKRTWRQHYPNAVLLIQGKHVVCDPQLTLDGPPKLVEKLNKLHAEFETLGGWEVSENREEAEEISVAWNALLGQKWN